MFDFKKEKENCHKILRERFEAETGYIFTNDENYVNSEMDNLLRVKLILFLINFNTIF